MIYASMQSLHLANYLRLANALFVAGKIVQRDNLALLPKQHGC